MFTLFNLSILTPILFTHDLMPRLNKNLLSQLNWKMSYSFGLSLTDKQFGTINGMNLWTFKIGMFNYKWNWKSEFQNKVAGVFFYLYNENVKLKKKIFPTFFKMQVHVIEIIKKWVFGILHVHV